MPSRGASLQAISSEGDRSARSSIIAIVDDDLGMREALVDLLESLGYDTLAFSSAEEFLSFQPRSMVSFMIIDMKMGGRSGLELQTIMNTDGGSPPHIFMTSYFGDRIQAKALAGGARAFLSKPVHPPTLIATIKKVMDHRDTCR